MLCSLPSDERKYILGQNESRTVGQIWESGFCFRRVKQRWTVVVSFHGYRCSASSSLLECSKSWELGFCPRSSFVCVSHVLGWRLSAAVISVSTFHGRHMCFLRFSIVTGAVHKLICYNRTVFLEHKITTVETIFL